MTNQEEVDTTAWLTRLCLRYGATDMPQLLETAEFKKQYAALQAKAPKLSAQSLTAKALEEMSFIPSDNATVKAHVLRVPHIKYGFDENVKEGSKTVPEEVGILVVTSAGRSMFIPFGTYDPLKNREENVRVAKLPEVAVGAPCMLEAVNIFEDLKMGDVKVRLTKASKVVPGGHSEPFPDGPDLEAAFGPLARKNGWGAYKRDDRTGTLTGRFGDREGKQTVFVGMTGDETENKVRDYADDPNDPADPHVLQATVRDRSGLAVSAKLPLAEVRRQMGLSSSAPRDAILARTANKRIVLAGNGNIFASVDPKDLFGDQAKGVIEDLSKKGLLVVGRDSRHRLSLKALPAVYDASGKPVQQDYITIGDKNIYAIEEKGEGKWEFSVLAESLGRKPWFTIKQGEKKNKDGEVEGIRNEGSFFLFLDAIGGAEVPETDPLMQAIRQLKLVVA